MKALIKSSWPYLLLNRWREQTRFRRWLRDGRQGPPPHLAKQAVLREFHDRYQLPTLVETGTYLGDMVEAMRRTYSRIYSIELSAELHQRAKRRFAQYPIITILQGDSGEILVDLVPRLTVGAVFWLDGHYSGGVTAKGSRLTPILAELSTVMALTIPFVVLIDDAPLFNGTNEYPTLAALMAHVTAIRPGSSITVETDIIRIIPSSLVAASVTPSKAS